MELDRIVVGVDGSSNSTVALAWTAGLAALVDAEVVAVHAVGLLEASEGGEPQPSQPHREEIRHRFESEWCAPLDDAGVPARRLLRDGSPVSVLLEVADEVDADMVVVGSRGVGAFPQMLLGSTSTQVAQASTRPVIIIPAATG